MTDTIVRVAARGDGVTADGRHVALAAPGDVIRPDGSVEPGAHHQAPPCRHFPVCGGCQLQHLDEESYSSFVFDRIASALTAQGLSAAIRPPALSPPRTRRRATLHAERRGRQVLLGFTEGASHRIVDMAECWVLAPELFALLAPLRKLLAALMPERGRANVHLASTDRGPDVLIEARITESLTVAEEIIAFAGRNGLARFAVDEGMGPEVRWEPEPVTIALGGVPVPFPPASFLQATVHGEAALVAAVREAVDGAMATADLFAGLGTFTFALSGKLYAAEAARDAVLALKAAAGRAGRPVLAEHRDLFRRPLVPAELDRFDAIVLDPPRAGAREQAVQLAASRAARIAYVSCNPSSFARDAKIICEGGYRLDWVQPVGQFTWSTHVELAAAFSRQG
ncbi:class I SAM-dependent RNA methyltransferase [Sphingomonas cannabina]|nr:class I SAM-dependent RNA methyltransferase [Sphingomonas cannabina]UIJ43623.1 class I SAM-dependent RNA methyltransferase [Sphingomonas cannabina]